MSGNIFFSTTSTLLKETFHGPDTRKVSALGTFFTSVKNRKTKVKILTAELTENKKRSSLRTYWSQG